MNKMAASGIIIGHIVETDVFGVKGTRAECQACGWIGHCHDGAGSKAQARANANFVKHSKQEHGAW